MQKRKLQVVFHETRQQHMREAAEDYTELIAQLISECGQATTCEVAARLGISHVTAIRTLRRLDRDGYIKTRTRHPLILTKKGAALAAQAKLKHELLLKFLIKIGVPKKAALLDVEGIEHHISPTTLRSIEKFLKTLD